VQLTLTAPLFSCHWHELSPAAGPQPPWPPGMGGEPGGQAALQSGIGSPAISHVHRVFPPQAGSAGSSGCCQVPSVQRTGLQNMHFPGQAPQAAPSGEQGCPTALGGSSSGHGAAGPPALAAPPAPPEAPMPGAPPA
jgi:hypothetical protein